MDEATLKVIIGKNVRRYRKAHGLTQEALAELVGREPSAISHIERMDRLMGIELLVRLADVFSISTDSLVRPEGSVSRLESIAAMLAGQSEESLSRLEPILSVWLSQYGSLQPFTQGQPKIEERRDTSVDF